LLEAINLALKCQINRRSAAYELHPYLINTACVEEYLRSVKSSQLVCPPEILIELYLSDSSELAELKGTNNSLMENLPGISLKIALDDNLKEKCREYIAEPTKLSTIPIEYYSITWQSFAGDTLITRALLLDLL
jgi:putative ATP-dependent endonuclease of the OLD family